MLDGGFAKKIRKHTLLATGVEIDTTLAPGGTNLTGIDLGCEAQAADALTQLLLVGRDVDKHQRLRVATQRILEQVCQLAVAVRDVAALVGYGGIAHKIRG